MAIEINSDEVHSAPLASATVMVLRDSAAGPEVLMMRRHG
ncbi:MAG: NUDIX hydrolase, partial [Burkholderiaceae bacterium]|nr:NUDIX hydrolase [Burkholderiaceae bacterium]